MVRHAAWILTRYKREGVRIDRRADTGTLLFPDKIVMEQHSLTHLPSQAWSKVQESED